MDKKKLVAIINAVLAAVLYAVNMPMSKLLLQKIEPTFMASFLYFGAGIGIGAVYLSRLGKHKNMEEKLTKPDLPFVVGMIILDIVAPIFLMIGLLSAASSNASLLNNFEIAATSLIALFVFKEMITKRLWIAISLIILSSILLTFEDLSSFKLSYGSVFILAATVCWGFENNCTRKLSSKSTYQIVMIKGIFSGLGSFIVAMIIREDFPQIQYFAYALLLGFISYGLSIFLYIRAQKELGAAKTSAFYAIAPFAGALLSFLILRETITGYYLIALLIMIAGSVLVVIDTLNLSHEHMHAHLLVYTEEGVEHNHVVEHSHSHRHIAFGKFHKHKHKKNTSDDV